jgi:hypothetical protein
LPIKVLSLAAQSMGTTVPALKFSDDDFDLSTFFVANQAGS